MQKKAISINQCQPLDALVERLTGEVSLAEQISVMVDTICPQVAITMMMIIIFLIRVMMMMVVVKMPKAVKQNHIN